MLAAATSDKYISPPRTLSLRDPAGRVLEIDGRILRAVKHDALPVLEAGLSLPFIRQLTGKGYFIRSEKLASDVSERLMPRLEGALGFDPTEVGALFEHPVVSFLSFPHEWCPEMLWDAAKLTLDLMDGLLEQGFGLKDATPYNVFFRGTQPVFVDILSIESRKSNDPLWLAFGQFARTFLNPLLAIKYFQVPSGPWLLARREGILPEEIYAWSRRYQRFFPPVLGLATLPVWLARRKHRPDLAAARETDEWVAKVTLRGLLRSARRTLLGLKPPVRNSVWSEYRVEDSYTAAEFARKQEFVERVFTEHRLQNVLDIGSNTGRFSELAAKSGASVVAVDADTASVGRIWRAASQAKLDILPLVVNVAEPTPSTGWLNCESASFLRRAEGKFEAVLMLAVCHHLVAGHLIPLGEIANLLACLTRRFLVFEFVDYRDPMFQRLAQGRDFSYVTKEAAESELGRHFRILRQIPVTAKGRHLYLLERIA